MISLRSVLGKALSLMASAALAQTGVYHVFPEDTASWTVDQYHSGCMGYCASVFYEMKGDTLINGASYNMLFSSTGDFYYTTPPLPPDPGVVGGSFAACTYAGALRQDSAAQRVYFIAPGMSTETLVFDFSLAIGDTMPPWYDPWAIGTLVVTAIDSASINNTYHRVLRFTTEGGPTTDLIEGVGWSTGFLGVALSPDGLIQLACFRSSTVASPAFNNECLTPLGCDLLLGTEVVPPFPNRMRIGPNPFVASTVVQFQRPLRNATLTLSDMLGRPVLQRSGINGTSIIIDRNGVTKGTYLLQLTEKATIIGTAPLMIADE